MNDRRARFEAQVLPHLDAAYRFARWLSYSPADAQDVVQDALLRAFRSFDSLRGSDARTWLLVIVRNCHFTAARQRRRRAAVPLPEEHESENAEAMISQSPGPEVASILRDQARTWDRLIAALPEEQRTVLLLREIEDLDYAQIATVTAVPIGTVMSRLARARAALRSRWLSDPEETPHAVR
ncbi:MAG TPA: sigma-70 family RNA polymerase sigma factor [Steroidobacteraceae bacterium]|nr:sigma-70 family RNA polymerase sigma factor [Steroidobacteraceae bacterium]